MYGSRHTLHLNTLTFPNFFHLRKLYRILCRNDVILFSNQIERRCEKITILSLFLQFFKGHGAYGVVFLSKLIFITLEKLLEMKANNEKFKLVEVLSEESYNEGHIPGAINIPFSKLEELKDKYLKKTDKIVVYCANYGCQASTRAARKLLKLGYNKTVDFKAGKRGWIHFGLELEK